MRGAICNDVTDPVISVPTLGRLSQDVAVFGKKPVFGNCQLGWE
jgi:hypothetical protein